FGRTAQDAEHVVLRRRQVPRLEYLGGTAGEQIAGTQQVQERRLLRASRPPPAALRLNRSCHTFFNNTRCNEYCQDGFRHRCRLTLNLGCGDGPAVNDVITTVNRSSAFGREESHQLCDLFRRAWSAQRNAAEEVH